MTETAFRLIRVWHPLNRYFAIRGGRESIPSTNKPAAAAAVSRVREGVQNRLRLQCVIY